MPKCAVKSCKSNTLTTKKKDGVSYFRFPINETEREKWRTIIATERGEESFKPNNSSVVCSNHFLENDFYFTKCGRRKVKKNILPRVVKTERENEDETEMRTDVNDLSTPPPTPSGVTLTIDSLITSACQKLIYKTERENEDDNKTRTDVNDRRTPPPTSSGVTLMVDSPKTSACQKFICKTESENEDENKMRTDVNNRRTPPPTSSVVTITVESPKTSAFKKSLETCQKFIELKNRQIINLKKKNKRLMKKCLNLKGKVTDLKKELRVHKPSKKTLNTTVNEFTIIRDILTAKRKVPFGTYPPDLRKFSLNMYSHSPNAYKYLREVFSETLPHPNTLMRWQKPKTVQWPDPNFVIVEIPEINHD
ncbi:unnamed protein product [Chilo suppressalis]|uniref:THAP-type domain-containing protein n=1 Tax=Chilo suppressalis TaxID=168631 RepID=A0ABN8AX36_CHISP|nr:unnamed protein product [Chilo suppressalis]